jgi:hypothetical protein
MSFNAFLQRYSQIAGIPRLRGEWVKPTRADTRHLRCQSERDRDISCLMTHRLRSGDSGGRSVPSNLDLGRRVGFTVIYGVAAPVKTPLVGTLRKQ